MHRDHPAFHLMRTVCASILRVLAEVPENRPKLFIEETSGMVDFLFDLALDCSSDAETALAFLVGACPSYLPMDHGQPLDSVLFHLSYPSSDGYWTGTTQLVWVDG